MNSLVGADGNPLMRNENTACQVCHLPIMVGKHGDWNECFQTLQVYGAHLAMEMVRANAILAACAFFPVQSSNIDAVGFRRMGDDRPCIGGILIKFKNGQVYYSEAVNIPLAEFGELLAAESTGQHFKQVLEIKYKFLRFTPSQLQPKLN